MVAILGLNKMNKITIVDLNVYGNIQCIKNTHCRHFLNEKMNIKQTLYSSKQSTIAYLSSVAL